MPPNSTGQNQSHAPSLAAKETDAYDLIFMLVKEEKMGLRTRHPAIPLVCLSICLSIYHLSTYIAIYIHKHACTADVNDNS